MISIIIIIQFQRFLSKMFCLEIQTNAVSILNSGNINHIDGLEIFVGNIDTFSEFLYGFWLLCVTIYWYMYIMHSLSLSTM